MPGAGDLDRIIKIERNEPTQGETGELEEKWVDHLIVRAARRDVRGNERVAAEQRLAERVAIFTVRWRPDITPMHRIVERNAPGGSPEWGRVWDIQGLAEIGRRRWLDITAETHN